MLNNTVAKLLDKTALKKKPRSLAVDSLPMADVYPAEGDGAVLRGVEKPTSFLSTMAPPPGPLNPRPTRACPSWPFRPTNYPASFYRVVSP
jgi:hypothetical protein